MKIMKLQQKTKAWIDFRRSHVCASDAPVIMGQSPYRKLDQLYKEKTQGFEQSQNPYMARGVELEPIALEEFMEETGLVMFPVVAKHDELDWMAASFDGVTICRTAIVEIKCPGKKDHFEATIGCIPKKYIAQVQHQIYVADVQKAYYYSFDGEKGAIVEVKRDPVFISIMLEKEFEFWKSLQVLNQEKENATRAIS